DQEGKELVAMIEGGEAEKKRIALELHNQLGFMFTTLDRRLKLDLTELDDTLWGELKTDIHQIQEKVRETSHKEGQSALALQFFEENIKVSLQEVRKSKDLKVHHTFSFSEERLPLLLRGRINLILNELLNNTLKHAEASRIELEIVQFQYEEEGKEGLSLLYSDNGKGIPDDIRASKGGHGLKVLHALAQSLDAIYEIDSNPRSGTTHNFQIPLPTS
ncbi:MAG: ATP-binding protein, partial [Bacteroidota bacterium]